MIARYVLHLEAHRGRRPHVSLRRAPRHGDRVVDAGIPGTLEACEPCSGDGFLMRPGRNLTPLERIRYAVAAGIGVAPRLLGLPPLAPDQGRRAVPPPAGKNDHDGFEPGTFARPDDAAERSAREYFGPDYLAYAQHGDHTGTGYLVAYRAGYEHGVDAGLDHMRAQRDEARDLLEGLQAEVNLLRRAATATGDSRLNVHTDIVPDEAARAHPLHAAITDALRWPGRGQIAPVARIWGRGAAAGHDVGAPGNVWAGDPEDVADLILRAIAATPPGPVTSHAWARLRSVVPPFADPGQLHIDVTQPGGGA